MGKYRIGPRLGQGGMGVVYEAEDTLLHRRVALKLLPETIAAEPGAGQRFLREARTAARLRAETTMTWSWIAQRLAMGHWRTALNATRLIVRQKR